MSDAYGPSGGAMLRRALLLTAGCGAAALMVPRWMAGEQAAATAAAPNRPQAAPRRQAVRPRTAPVPAEDNSTIFDNELTFHAGRNHQFWVRAAVNGIEIPFMIDTGASFVALRYDDAESIGMNAGNLRWNMAMSTANGRAMAASVTLGSVRLDRAIEYNVPAIVMQQNAATISLLGMSFLARLKSWRIHDSVLSIRY